MNDLLATLIKIHPGCQVLDLVLFVDGKDQITEKLLESLSVAIETATEVDPSAFTIH